MEAICKRFIDLIEAGDYYEAHEVLEEAWYPRRFEDDDEVRLIKGYINASVAFELVRKGRMEPAQRTWKIYMKYRPLLENMKSPARSRYETVEKVLDARYEQLFGM